MKFQSGIKRYSLAVVAMLCAGMCMAGENLKEGDRIVFLGDSITAAGVRPDGYITLADKAVQLAYPDLGVELIGAGIGGHKVPNCQQRLDRDVLQKKPAIVFIYIGINDVWHSTSGRGTPAGEFESGLRTLIRDFQESGAEVVLATPSVIGEKRQGENKLDGMLTEYSAISRRVAKEESATLCDLQRAFSDHLRIFNPQGLAKGVLTSDGVHLNAAGNQLLATEAARSLRAAAESRSK